MCLKARDYKGCIESIKRQDELKPKDISSSGDNCFGNNSPIYHWCIAGNGNDLQGKPKIKGWGYTEIPEGKLTLYIDTSWAQLDVSKAKSRYIATTVINRTFRPYKASQPERQIIKDNKLKLDCDENSFNRSDDIEITCRASSEIDMQTIAGKTGHPEGVREWAERIIVDCWDQDFIIKRINSRKYSWENYIQENMKWEPLNNENGFNTLIKKTSKQLCRNSSKLPIDSNNKFKLKDF